MAGGKLTTYRLIGEEAVDQIAEYLGRTARPSETGRVPLLEAGELMGSGIEPPEVSRELVEHYCRREWAVHLEDVMVRRTSWRYYLDQPDAVAEQVAGWDGGGVGVG